MSSRRPQRVYRSTLRDERSADTRQRIATAAARLFAENGFVNTTVPAIAEKAGVSQPTVYAAFGSKAGIVAALIVLLEEDADAASWRRRIDDEADIRRKLELFAAWSRHLYSNDRKLMTAILAASNEPGIAELHAQGDRRRREWLEGVVRAIAEARALRAGLSSSEALDCAWMLTSFEVYFRATDGCGWPDEKYERWLADLLIEQLCRTARRSLSKAAGWSAKRIVAT